MLEVLQPDDSRSCKVGIEQSLAADGATAFFSSILIPSRLDAQRAPQLKASVSSLLMKSLEVSIDGRVIGVFIPPDDEPFSR
jgi:hypothetical protein